MTEHKVNLFVYGSLRDPRIFKSVSGYAFTRKASATDSETLLAELALLSEYRRVSPDNVYHYAVKDSRSRIEGLVIYDLPLSAMDEIDRYEGKRYKRETVEISTAKGSVKALAYLASKESMQKHFGDRFHVNLIHELWLRKRIDRFMKKHTRPGETSADAELERQADRELLGTTERDLVITHYRSDAVSDYYLKHELDRPRPSIRHLYDTKQAKPYIHNYLVLVIKQVLLNQLDEKIQNEYRYELEHIRTSERYFKRSISLLIALEILNANQQSVHQIIERCFETKQFAQNDLIDYIKYAVRAARSFFDKRVASFYLDRIRANFFPGLVPLGAELELSNLGFRAIDQTRQLQGPQDAAYDGFKFFNDFSLDVLFWKLGGYIDDHSGSPEKPGRKGFLELAPGRLNIEGEISRPATADPWLLNQLIHGIIRFYDVEPHSLHLSYQLLKHQIGKQKTLPLGYVKCLFVLGGGIEQTDSGRLWVSRMAHDEIKQHTVGEELVFARTSKRKWYMGDNQIGDKTPKQAITYIQQYKFIRLDARANYEPLIMCLKGLQLGYNPGDYLSIRQLQTNKKLRNDYEALKEWSSSPTPISPQTIRKFLDTVHEGLMNESHRRPAHKLHYIDWVLSAIDVQLRMFNQQLQKSPSQ